MGGGGVSEFPTFGGGLVWTPPFLVDIICEQPLSTDSAVVGLAVHVVDQVHS